jgi:hypothetical protein
VWALGSKTVREQWDQAYPTVVRAALPDVTLHFVYPEYPSLVIANQSGTTAREIKWEVVLWNLDLPEHTNPLPIPTASFDFIMPHSLGGPQDLFSSPAVAPPCIREIASSDRHRLAAPIVREAALSLFTLFGSRGGGSRKCLTKPVAKF